MATSNVAEFHIIGRVASITPLDKVTKVTIASNYQRKIEDKYEDAVRYNTVNVWNKNTVDYISRELAIGDLIRVTGNLEQSNYQDGDDNTVYTVELHASLFARVAQKKAQAA